MFSYREHTDAEIEAYRKASMKSEEEKWNKWKKQVKDSPSITQTGRGLSAPFANAHRGVAIIDSVLY